MNKKVHFALLLLLCVSPFALGQVPPGPPPPPPPGLPIDGGVLFLLLSGLVYGINKIKR